MVLFFRCVAEAAVEKGLHGLLELVPGGSYLSSVAESAWKKYRERAHLAGLRDEVRDLAQASFDEARAAAAEAVEAAVPPAVPLENRINLELFLTRVPETVRRSLARPEDATGTTLPPGYAVRSADDLLAFLPGWVPRFAPGHELPGRPGWALVRPLGTGGFGEVWLARDTDREGSECAVKFCRPERAAELRHEAGVIGRVIAAGGHPNIVRLLDADLDAEAPWLMYEYVRGGVAQRDLGEWVLALRRLPPEARVRQAVLALRQLCPAVAHFHRLTPAVVHRDLKPGNILVDAATRRFKITDFGIGGVTAGAARLDARSSTGGRGVSFLRGAHSPLYSSPQQRDGAPPDPRDDVHALGVIAFQLLTGQLTRGPGTDFGHDLRELGINSALAELIGECVAQAPGRRPADAGELDRRVRAVLAPGADHDPLEPSADTPAPAPGPSVRVVEYEPEDDPDPGPPQDDWVPPRRPKRTRIGLAVLCLTGGLLVLVPAVGVVRKLGRTESPPAAAVREDRRAATPRPLPDRPPAPGRPVTTPARPDPSRPMPPPDVSPRQPDPPRVDTSGDAQRLDGLVAAAKDPDPSARRRSAEGLATFLAHGDERLRRTAAVALAGLGRDAAPASEALRAAARDTDTEVRRWAGEALAAVQDAEVAATRARAREELSALAADLKAKEPAKRVLALGRIAGYGTEGNMIAEQVIEAMTDRAPAVRDAATEALEKINPRVHPHVVTILRGMAKYQAMEALGDLGLVAEPAVPLLLHCHTNPGAFPSTGLTPNILAIVAKIAPGDRRFATVVLGDVAAPAGPTDPFGARRFQALTQLKAIGATPAEKAKALTAALADGKCSTQVITALGDLGKEAAPAVPLLRKLKGSPVDEVRAAATAALRAIE